MQYITCPNCGILHDGFHICNIKLDYNPPIKYLRNYKCGNCNSEFDLAVIRNLEYFCPFCNMKMEGLSKI